MGDHPLPQRSVGFLDVFEASQIEHLLWYIERVQVEAGDVLIAEGDVDQSLFVIDRGVFEVTRRARRLARLKSGHVIGELAFFGESPRSASVMALEAGEVLRLTRAGFEQMRRRDAELACALALEVGRALAERFRHREESYRAG